MSPEGFAFGVAVAVFAAVAIGLFLQHLLPEKFTTGGPRDMIGAVVGLLTLLSALVVGLLIWTAYGVYSGQNLAVQTLAAKDLQLDLALADYVPDATPLRALIRDQIGKTIDQIWRADSSDLNFVADNFAGAVQNQRSRQAGLEKLHPTTDDQKQALASASSAIDAIAQSRLQMSFALTDLLSARCGRGRMGGVSVLRLWLDVERQRDVGGRGRCRRAGDFERGLSDPRPQRPVFRGLPRFAGAA